MALELEVEVVTAGFSKTVVSTFGIPILVEKNYDEIEVSDYDALAIPGERGYKLIGFALGFIKHWFEGTEYVIDEFYKKMVLWSKKLMYHFLKDSCNTIQDVIGIELSEEWSRL